MSTPREPDPPRPGPIGLTAPARIATEPMIARAAAWGHPPRGFAAARIAAAALLACLAARPADGEENARVALKGLDPVALVGGREVAGREGLAATHERFRYLFSDEAGRAAFAADPDRYAIQGHGACAVTPSVPASPDIFAVHDGRIYAFAGAHCLAAFRRDPAEYLKPPREVVILVYDGVELLDLAGPGEVFSSAGGGRAFRITLVAAARRARTSQGFAVLEPGRTFADGPKPDVLVIPGGATAGPAKDPATLAWIKEASARAELTLSVCTGSLLLGEAGLLDGLDATTHRDSIARLRAACPRAKVLEGRRFVDAGQVVTSAGVSAGIDASIHVVGRILGREAAEEVARRIEYPATPTGGGIR